MFDIGFLELLIIGVVGLLVLGPERLPRAARTTGLWIGKIKRTVSGMQRDISAQLEAEELRQSILAQQSTMQAELAQLIGAMDVLLAGAALAPSPSTAPPADGSCRDCAIDLCDSD